MIKNIIKFDCFLEQIEKKIIEEKVKIKDYTINDLVEVSEEIYKIDKFQDIVKRFDILIDNVKN
jgi:hypothetical protein